MNEERWLALEHHPYRNAGLLALLSLPSHFFLPLAESQQLAAIVLGLVAGVYLGYAFQDGRRGVILLESAVALLFLSLAAQGLSRAPWLLALGYVAHGLWDLAHHRHVPTELPRWYIPACVLYDWVLGLALLLRWYVIGA